VQQLRAVIWSHLHTWGGGYDWNDFSALDAAARLIKPETFHAIFEEELENRLEELRKDGCSADEVAAERGRHRFNLLKTLRDEFDRRLRELLAPDKKTGPLH
jgi:hypothetical protein